MNGLSAAVVTACAASLIGAVVSGFVTDGGIKKILGLVLGAFTICAMIVPVSRAASDFSVNIDSHQSYGELTATARSSLSTRQDKTSRLPSPLFSTRTASIRKRLR